tara:strand:+ start:507 stop:953 length:447 start_codon:yes stop_codon:yes gene_type:complete
MALLSSPLSVPPPSYASPSDATCSLQSAYGNSGLSDISLEKCTTLGEAFLRRCEEEESQAIYVWLDKNGLEDVRYTFLDVYVKAKKVMSLMQTQHNVAAGKCVALCFQPSLDFIISFWACVLAGNEQSFTKKFFSILISTHTSCYLSV